jgi:hypothetical protein
LIEVDEGLVVPDMLSNLTPADDLAAPLSEDREHLERLRRQLDQIAVLRELAALRIEIEWTKTQHGRVGSRDAHDIILSLTAERRTASCLKAHPKAGQ